MTNVAAATDAPADLTRVRVWFGEHPIIDWTGDPHLAVRMAQAQARRFPSCRVTAEAVARGNELH